MGATTEIAWTDATWNPVRGCSRVSPGCENCYAEKVAARFSGPGQPYHGLAVMGPHGARWTREVRLVPEHLEDPLRWRRPRRIFVNSMSDLFHESLAEHDIDLVFDVMEKPLAQDHVFQILTKRADRMRSYVTKRARPVVRNVWLGVSVEDQERAEERIPDLLQTPAAVRFVSYEPALGAVEFAWPWLRYRESGLTPLDWIIVGGESGPDARPFDLRWARDVAQQCRETTTACFIKQLGANPMDRGRRLHFADRKGADPDEWPDDLRVRQFPEAR